MNKSCVFLVTFILLLGIAVVPTGSVNSATLIEPSSLVNAAAAATTGTLRIRVVDDVSVISDSFADMNFDGDANLFLGAVYLGSWQYCRSWFRFNLSQIPVELSVQSATMNVHIRDEFNLTDEAIGVYHSTDDTWDSTSLTWNNQPGFSSIPSDVIDSPASPDMFQSMNWYSWDVTSDVRSSLIVGDMFLTEVLKQTSENPTYSALMYPSRSVTYPWNATYLEIQYTTPTTSGLSVDGISTGPLLEYINNPCPDLGWTFSDPDYSDFQKDYEIELWNSTFYNETMLWQGSHEFVSTIYESGAVNGNWHPFGDDNEFRMQMKYPNTELPRSGIVDKLYFISPNNFSLAQLENLEISLLMVGSAADLTADFAVNRDGRTPTIVLSRDSYELALVDNMIEIDVENTFFLNHNLNLIVEIRLTNNTGETIPLSRFGAGGPGNVACNDGDSESTAASYVTDRTYDLRIGFLTQSVFESAGVAWNRFPFSADLGTSARFQIKYNQSYINRAGIVDRLYFKGDSIDQNIVLENFTVSLVETPVLGNLDHTDWESNYGGNSPVVVLDESMYTIVNLGNSIVLEFDNTFYYSNTHDLLIDFKFDSHVSGMFNLSQDMFHTSSYRAWNLTRLGMNLNGYGTGGYDLLIDFVNNENSVPLEGCITLINSTWYYLRARTCDSAGMWGEWTTLEFKYEVITSIPSFSQPIAVPDPAQVDQEVTVSINVTHTLGISDVAIEFDGTNHTMSASGDTFSYTWTPTTAVTVNYTIYMQSNANTWSSVEGSFVVEITGGGFGDMTLILVIGAVAVVIVVIVVVVLKKKSAKK